jgi:hypothetical protein
MFGTSASNKFCLHRVIELVVTVCLAPAIISNKLVGGMSGTSNDGRWRLLFASS